MFVNKRSFRNPKCTTSRAWPVADVVLMLAYYGLAIASPAIGDDDGTTTIGLLTLGLLGGTAHGYSMVDGFKITGACRKARY